MHPATERSSPNSRHDTSLPVVLLPTELRDLHPVVKAIQDDSGRLRMGPSLRHRCLLYFHGLTQEAVRRGYAVREQSIAPEHRGRFTTYGRSGAKDYSRREGELNIVVDGFSYLVMIDQQHSEAEDLDRYCQLYVWVRGPVHPTTAAVPAGTMASAPPSTTRSHRCCGRSRLGQLQQSARRMTVKRSGRPPWTRLLGLPLTTAWSPSWNRRSGAGGRPRPVAVLRCP